MSRRSVPNQRKAYKDLNKRLNGYTRKIVAIYSMLAYESALYAIENGYDGDGEFHFSDYPKTKKKANTMFQNFRNNMQALIYSGISNEWKRSNAFQDQLANGVIKTFKRTINEEKRKLWYDTNGDALEAFKKRKTAGLTISQRIWKDEPLVRSNLERALTAGIAKGVSAVQLSKRVTKYLNDYSTLSRDYRKKCGKAIDIAGCEYRSIRLARNEINLAYRTAEQERWKKMDYIKGKSIHVTQNGSHKTDMCDALAGDYPKTFQWEAWHINCMCYAVPIVASEEEYWGNDDLEEVKTVPEGFKKWLEDTENNIEQGFSPPTFLKNNDNYNRYLKYKNDDNYVDVQLNGNLGVSASHVNHGHKEKQEMFRFSDGLFTGDELEKEMQTLAFEAGHSAILLEEGKLIRKGDAMPAFDLELDGEIVDIASATQNRSLYNWQIYNKNKQVVRHLAKGGTTQVDTVCIYFHDPTFYGDQKIIDGYNEAVKMIANKGYKQYIKRVMCAIKTPNGLRIKEFDFR